MLGASKSPLWYINSTIFSDILKFQDLELRLYIDYLEEGCMTGGKPFFNHAAVKSKSQRLEITISYKDTSDILLPHHHCLSLEI